MHLEGFDTCGPATPRRGYCGLRAAVGTPVGNEGLFYSAPKEISKDFVVWGFFLRFARARFLLLGTPCGTREVSG